MDSNWDVKKAEQLMNALTACQTLEELKSLGRGIAILPSSVLSEKSRNWLRDIYISCATSLGQPPFNPKEVLTKEGQKWLKKNAPSAEDQQKKTT